jgi:hypothetical protein
MGHQARIPQREATALFLASNSAILKCCRLRSLRSLRPTWPEAIVGENEVAPYSPEAGL